MRMLGAATAAVVTGALVVLAAATPAGAELDDPCVAAARLDNGQSVNPKRLDRVVVPRKATVKWVGEVPGEGTRAISGEVVVKLPWPFGEVTVGSWKSTSSLHRNSDEYKYDFPTILQGMKIPVSGYHQDSTTFRCNGSIVAQLEGRPAANPAFYATVALTFISIAGVGMAMRAKRVPV